MNKVWVEKYRPLHVNDIILTNDYDKQKFAYYVNEKEFPNLLLHGLSGTGKSSMSFALARDCGIDSSDILKINCSDEHIDALRDKVKNFVLTMPFSRFKVVRLEEIDYLGHEGMALLRDLIETSSNSCRFIGTCNYINKIIPALRSRFQEFVFSSPDQVQIIELIKIILEKENIEYNKSDIEKIVISAYPDFRKIIQILQNNSINGELKLNYNNNSSDWKLQLLPLLECSNLKEARKLVCSSASKEELIDIFRFLYNNIHLCKIINKDEAILLIAKYMYRHSFCADPELNIAALFIELIRLI